MKNTNFEGKTEPVRPTPGPTMYTPAPRFRDPIIITQETLNLVTAYTWNNSPSSFMPQILVDKKSTNAFHNTAAEIDLENYFAPIFHPTTEETISKYQDLEKDLDT